MLEDIGGLVKPKPKSDVCIDADTLTITALPSTTSSPLTIAIQTCCRSTSLSWRLTKDCFANGMAYAHKGLLLAIDPVEYIGKKVLAVPRCCQMGGAPQTERELMKGWPQKTQAKLKINENKSCRLCTA